MNIISIFYIYLPICVFFCRLNTTWLLCVSLSDGSIPLIYKESFNQLIKDIHDVKYVMI